MKVAFFIPSLSNKGGVEVSTINLINSLAKYKHRDIDVSLIVFTAKFLISNLDSSVKVFCLNIENYKTQYLILAKKLRRITQSNNIDIVVTVESMSYLFTFLPLFTLKQRPKIVIWEHFNYKNDNGLKSRGFLRMLAAKTADLIVLLTERDVKEWKENININAKMTYIYNISTFDTIVGFNQSNSKSIISVGRYVNVKGFDRLIKIWEIFQNKYENSGWVLSIIGYGEDKDNLETLIKHNNINNIELISTDDVQVNYSEASFYCMTSYFEGLPMVLIEAQSFGLPSVAFDIFTGPSEILDDSTGILIRDGDLEAYADAIYTLISNPELRYEMSINALEASNRFSQETIAERWIHELQNLII